jgi:hypothetical protein
VNVPHPIIQANALDLLPAIPCATARTANDVETLFAVGEPVVIEHATDHWPALAAASRSPAALDDYLKDRDSGVPVPIMETPPSSGGRFGYSADIREFSFTRRNRPLAETLDRIAKARSEPNAGYLAIQMLPLDAQMAAFVRENPMPLVPASARPKLWLGGPVKTQVHNDRDHNLACVVAGHRRFLLFPPEQVRNLYIGPFDNPPPLSLVDPEAPDFDLFPRFREALATAQVAHLGPGDAILIPRYWWHHVTSLDPYNAMVNYWWGGSAGGLGDPHDAFLTALLALKALPAHERGYWQAMFETYVFSDLGVEHIPPSARGILSPTPPVRAALRQRLKAAVLKS